MGVRLGIDIPRSRSQRLLILELNTSPSPLLSLSTAVVDH